MPTFQWLCILASNRSPLIDQPTNQQSTICRVRLPPWTAFALNFCDAVCRLLSSSDLASASTLPASWCASASSMMAKIAPVDVAISKDKTTNEFHVFLSTYGLDVQPTLDTMRIHRFAIKNFDDRDAQFKREPLIGGLEGEIFRQILDIVSIQCRTFTLERIDVNFIDLSRLNPRNLENIAVLSCDTVSPDAELVRWLRNVTQFEKLKNLKIKNTPSSFPLLLNDHMLDLLVHSKALEIVESVADSGENFFHISDEFIRNAEKTWNDFDHRASRNCTLYRKYNWLTPVTLRQFPESRPWMSYRRGAQQIKVHVEISPDESEVTFQADVHQVIDG